MSYATLKDKGFSYSSTYFMVLAEIFKFFAESEIFLC